MDDLITLCTSDNPPVELKASRAVLAANSKVFADMLASPQGPVAASQGPPVDLAETQAELEPFLRLLNLAHDGGDPLKDLDDKHWPVVAKLADKYDSAPVRTIATGKCWQWSALANDLSSDQNRTAFETAVKLGNGQLAASQMLRFMMRVDDEKKVREAVGDSQTAFDAWLKLLKTHAAFWALEKPTLEFCDACTADDASLADATWYRAMREALRVWDDLKASKPFLCVVHAMSGALIDEGVLCENCENTFDTVGHSFEHHYRDTAPGFPL
ncbi:hypothetical protein JCM3775_003550 [Rhodotorula graminis]|uniref:BTB domain-containing protein n=1 Tax=Rhodotorula graminis (strain WP1) TaxID=578459 RepID=A0A194SA14_RHOGW|nr:uncharacterized protein RHOBADRAFT_51182 [Rhodotorula graminis WP1]KPV77305.1 hypothetical protein RHOBADRAFT_51182 [Rhodotorula graminis WP1]